MSTFKKFPLLPTLQETLIEKSLFKPTEIQDLSIPLILTGQSVVGVSETGSGKTLAYALPILHLIKTIEIETGAVTEEGRPRAIVVVPTRELGEQVSRVFKPFTHTTRLRVRVLLGGTDMDVAKRNVKGPHEILVATPGRLTQLMARGLVKLDDVRVLVFDEADQMLDQGFIDDAKKIVAACPFGRQLALFSATISGKVQDLISELFADAEILRSQGSKKGVSTLKTVNKVLLDGKRFPVLQQLLEKNVEGGTIIFTNTREQCDALAAQLAEIKKACVIYRGEMDKVERRSNLRAFRDGKVNVLISTDLASRGLDVDHIGRVINYHLPKLIDNYVHRVGRTARAGRSGTVINLVTERDLPLMERVEKMNGQPATLTSQFPPRAAQRSAARTNKEKKGSVKESVNKKTPMKVDVKKVEPKVAGKKALPKKAGFKKAQR